MIIRHFSGEGVNDPAYKVEDPHGIITSAYQVALHSLTEYVAMQQQKVGTLPRQQKRVGYLASLFTLAVGPRHSPIAPKNKT